MATGAPPDFASILANAQSMDPNLRDPATQALEAAEQSNLALYLASLLTVLSNEGMPSHVRRLASLCIKNTVDAKSEEAQAAKSAQWRALDDGSRQSLKAGVLQLLASPLEEARRGAAQVIAKIGAIEMEAQAWPELLPSLLANATAVVDASSGDAQACKRSTLETLGFLCEELDPAFVDQSSTNQILTAIIDGMGAERPGLVRLAATTALLNALAFCCQNMQSEAERNMIMQKICEATQCSDVGVRVAGYECIVRVASLYYEHLSAYMQTLFGLTFESARSDVPKVGVQALEFWSSVCEEEADLIAAKLAGATAEDGVPECKYYVNGALQFLLPLLLETLTKQEEDQDEDSDFNISMAGGTCLNLVAHVAGDAVVDPVMQFVTTNISSPDWHLREASTLAFGSILEGPSPEKLVGYIQPSLPVLLTAMTTDANVLVRDTSAWTVGLICQMFTAKGQLGETFPVLISHLLKALEDPESRVANNVCYAIHNLAEAFDESEREPTSPLSPHFGSLVQKLVATADRPDWQEKNLRVTAYEAINMLVQYSAADVEPLIMQMLPTVIQRLQATSAGAATSEQKEEQDGLQANLCSLIQVITQRMEEQIKPQAPQMMTVLLPVLQIKNAIAAGEALMAVGAIANAVEEQFQEYVPHLMPLLYRSLQNHEEYEVCAVAVGLVGDVCRAVEEVVLPYCNDVMTLLLQALQSPGLHRSVKPPVLSSFGDIALAIGGAFEPYMPVAMTMLDQASTTAVEDPDEDMIEYLNSLREGALEAYTGVIQGLKPDGKVHLLGPYVPALAQFLQMLAADENRDESVTKCAAGVLGDLASTLGPSVAPYVKQPYAQQLLTDAIDLSDDPAVPEWAQKVIAAL